MGEIELSDYCGNINLYPRRCKMTYFIRHFVMDKRLYFIFKKNLILDKKIRWLTIENM